MPASESIDARPDGADRYRVLLEASRRLGAKLSPDELYEAIYRETAEAVEASGFYLAVHDPSRDLARVVYYADRGKGRHIDIPYRGSDSEVITTQKPSIINKDLGDGSLMSLGDNKRDSTLSAVNAPLVHDGRLVGAISAQSYEENTYTQDDLDMIEGIAGIAAVSIHNSMQFAELDRRREEAERLEEIGRALTSKLDPDQVLSRIISAVSDVLHVDGAAVWLRDSRQDGVCRVAESGGEIAPPVGLEWELAGELLKTLIDDQAPFAVDNLATTDLLPAQVAEHLSGGSMVGVPLILGGQVEGILTAGSGVPRHFNGEDIAVLQRLANQASLALGNARLHARLHALSLTDPLDRATEPTAPPDQPGPRSGGCPPRETHGDRRPRHRQVQALQRHLRTHRRRRDPERDRARPG